jgi:hypothetical protein
MLHQTFITLPYALERDAPPFETNEIKSPESLTRYFLKKFTSRGDKVFDPFAGLGTSLFVTEDMGRIPFGIEADPQRHQWVAGQMEHWTNLVHGDSARLQSMGFPKMDFSFTSPPYMPIHHQWNPLFAGNPAKAGYKNYLKRMEYIYGQLAGLMKRGAYVVVQADNLPGRTYTPLVRDLSLAISKSLRPEAEIIVAWKNPKPDYLHTHCLVFKNS